MKTPTIKEVKKRFENAIIVNSAYFEEPFNINDFDIESIYSDGKDIYINHKTDGETVKSLFDEEKGYAKILTVK